MTSRTAARRIAVIALAALPTAIVVAQSQPPLTPGKYEGTFQVTLMGETEPPEKDEQCFSRDDLAGLDRWLAQTWGKDCTAADRKSVGSKVTFAINCPADAGSTTVRAELTIARDAFSAVLRHSDNAAGARVEGTMEIKARRVGECAR